MATVKGILVEPKTKSIKAVEIESSCASYYEAIGCDCIDIVNRDIATYDGLIPVSVVCDDEFRLKDGFENEPSIYNGQTNKMEFFGSVFICGLADEEGNEQSLTEDEIKSILEGVAKTNTEFPVLVCTYPQY